jgi:hypothetical protein
MFGILANNANNPVPLNYFAFVADWLYAGPDFHPAFSPKSLTFTSSGPEAARA